MGPNQFESTDDRKAGSEDLSVAIVRLVTVTIVVLLFVATAIIGAPRCRLPKRDIHEDVRQVLMCPLQFLKSINEAHHEHPR